MEIVRFPFFILVIKYHKIFSIGKNLKIQNKHEKKGKYKGIRVFKEENDRY